VSRAASDNARATATPTSSARKQDARRDDTGGLQPR
jgi:hypothetical protein